MRGGSGRRYLTVLGDQILEQLEKLGLVHGNGGQGIKGDSGSGGFDGELQVGQGDGENGFRVYGGDGEGGAR